MSEDLGEMKKLKYELELEKLDKLKYKWELEKVLSHGDNEQKTNVINRNFGVIITAIVSLAAVVVSYLQLTINSNHAKDQLELEKLKNDRQFELERLKSDRQFEFERLKNDREFYPEVAKFFLEHKEDLTTNDISKVLYLRNVVISAFPPEVAIQVSSRMKDTAPTPEARKVWDDGLTYLNKGTGTRSPKK